MGSSKTIPTLEKSLAYTFTKPSLLERALTHRSKSSRNNERLEFLGDSILGFIVASELYSRYPGLAEGELTRLRALLVKKETLATIARKLDLGASLRLGSGELKSGGFDRDSILADSLEAVFGAVYTDSGIDAVRTMILRLYKNLFGNIQPDNIQKDPKTRLQEYLQSCAKPLPEYRVLEIEGVPHNQKFHVECYIPDMDEPVVGEGASRRKAEQAAAARALELVTNASK